MTDLYDKRAIREMERRAQDELGLPSSLLMENAGARATDILVSRYSDSLDRVVVVGGTGQNGGDGWVVARHLACAGVRVVCVLVGDAKDIGGDARPNWERLAAFGVVTVVGWGEGARAEVREATLIVDALFGIGLGRPIVGEQAEAVLAMNNSSSPVVALDVPSGVDADTGAVLGVSVRAALTVTFGAMKLGLVQFPARELAGEVVVAPISAPLSDTPSARVITADSVRALLVPRARDAHKGTSGHVLIVAGSPGKSGASVLAALGALRAGAGLVTLALRSDDERRALEARLPVEAMTAVVADDDADSAAEKVCALVASVRARSVVLGPGLGRGEGDRRFARALCVALAVPTVIDADALFALGEDVESLRASKAERVLTPHPGEAATLLGSHIERVQAGRYEAARELSRRSGQVAVLKGASTVVSSSGVPDAVCLRGTPALGTGGTGDVLAGVVGALLASKGGLDTSTATTARVAAEVAVWTHGLAGELAASGDRGLLASEVAAAVPSAMAALWSKNADEWRILE
jgi:hydroxyethylthiazole kinase-like uncharacterized protein yjeF